MLLCVFLVHPSLQAINADRVIVDKLPTRHAFGMITVYGNELSLIL